ncbi:MAG: hypothetical protein Q8O68_00680 [Candidatus Daviesbacteria bacterium]|nr:hypothetical protein [Candidatus Daviesbacteria bacterium]
MKLKHCTKCNCEKELQKSTDEKRFGNLICRPIEQFRVAFNKIKVPRGWRIPTLQEGVDLVDDDKFVKWSRFDDEKHDFYIQQPFKRQNKRQGAWLRYNFSTFDICTNSGDFSEASRNRGCLFVRDADVPQPKHINGG